MCFNPSVVLYSTREVTAEWKRKTPIQKMTCSKVQSAEQHQSGAFPGWKRASSGDSVALSSTRKWHPCHFLVAYAFSCWIPSAQVEQLFSRDAVGAALGLATGIVDRRGILLCATALRGCTQCPKPAKATAAPPSFWLSQWREAGSEANGKMRKEKGGYRAHKCVCVEPLVHDRLHKIAWLIRLSNSHSHGTTAL